MPCFNTIRKKAPVLLEQLEEAEKNSSSMPYEMHDEIHEILGQLYPNQDVHKVLAGMSANSIKELWQVALMRAREKRRKKSLSRYLRQEGRTKQADEIDKELEEMEALEKDAKEVAAQ